jgi:predicted Zn-dependent peptidase
MYQKKILKNGLRLITVPQKTSETAAILILVGAGSRYETKKENGISHFLEHMFFKGTKKRPSALKIAETLDKVGGSYNAFTNKEFTGYWAKVHYQHLDLAVDWVSDIFLNSKIAPREIEKERGVIIEEMNMYQDTPVRYIADLWEKLLYGDQPAGWEIIGRKENILSFKRADFINYLKSHYSSKNTVVCVAGRFDERKVEKEIENYFKRLPSNSPKKKKPVRERQKAPQALSFFKETDQTHLALGVRGYSLADKERYAQDIIAAILGGNMSSRLFIEIREKRGLSYYVHTVSDTYTDCGYLATFSGVPHKDVKKVVQVIVKEYRKLREKGVSQKELKKAKDYLKGSLVLGLELSDAKAFFYSTQELLTNKIIEVEEKFKIIDSITREDVKKAAQHIFKNSKLNLALIGPHKNVNFLKKELYF